MHILKFNLESCFTFFSYIPFYLCFPYQLRYTFLFFFPFFTSIPFSYSNFYFFSSIAQVNLACHIGFLRKVLLYWRLIHSYLTDLFVHTSLCLFLSVKISFIKLSSPQHPDFSLWCPYPYIQANFLTAQISFTP